MNNNLSAEYVLANDIDCSDTVNWNDGEGFEPIGSSSNPFVGIFNGNNYKITNLYINRPSLDRQALFDTISDSYIHNINLGEGSITGNARVSGLVALAKNSEIYQCSSDIDITSIGSSSYNTAGLIAYAGPSTTINECYVTGNVAALGSNYAGTGGVVSHLSNSILKNSYATGNVSGNIYVGGVLGINDNSQVVNNYSTGKVSGYSNVGGFSGFFTNSPTFVSNYWDVQTSSRDISYGGAGKYTSEMKLKSTFVDWDFSSVWEMLANDYPRLAWQPDEPVEPTQITTCEELQAMNNNLSAEYVLANDIDCSDTVNWNDGEGFEPIGNNTTPFTGTFDGKHYKITGLYINRPTSDYQGLFGYTNGATIQNVGLECTSIKGKNHVGALVGFNYNYSTVSNSYAKCPVSGVQGNVGGLVGSNTGYSLISKSYATGSVSGANPTGGLAGFNNNSSTISNTYATGNVYSSADNSGGLAGANQHSSTISNSYAIGSSECVAANAGSLVGDNSYSSLVENSYASGTAAGSSRVNDFSGLVGWNYQATITSSSRKTIPQMKLQNTFSGWDFADIWKINEGLDYPKFQWDVPSLPTCTGCAVWDGEKCTAGDSCSGETPMCSVSENNGICVCNSGSCGEGRKCSGSVCVNCDAADGCGSCGCGSSQKPTGAGSCIISDACCPGECNSVTGPDSCSYSDALCPSSACNRQTLSCCASSLPYWRSNNCKACSVNTGLSGSCMTPGMECNAYYNCVTCRVNTQCTCDAGEVADGTGGCVTPICSSDSECGGDRCVNAGKHDAFCSDCSSYNQIWFKTSCASCPANSTYSSGVCICTDGKSWNSATNTCSDKGITTSSGDSISLKRNNSVSAISRYDRIKSRMNRIRSKIQDGTGNK